MRASKFVLLTVLTAGLQTLVHAWSDTGHMVIASVAERSIKPQTLAEARRLLAIGGTEKTSTFLTAACWADDSRSAENGPWHYTNQHFRTDGKTTNNQPLEQNVVWAIERFRAVLADRSKPDAERADALRYLLHFVGDVHQPLHTVARDTDAHPKGDRGGNEFRIQTPAYAVSAERPPRNLHSLWDSGLGLFTYEPRPLAADAERRVRLQAETLMAALPPIVFPAVGNLTPATWAVEGLDLSKSLVYSLPEGGVPPEDYVAKGRAASARLATLAGYRLAAMLDKALAP